MLCRQFEYQSDRGTAMSYIKKRRWKAWIVALMASAGLAGCTRPLYMTPETHHLANSIELPRTLETDPSLLQPPQSVQRPKPATINDSERKIRLISLQEAIAIGLENGNRGSAAATSVLAGLSSGQTRGGIVFNDELVSFTGRGIAGDDSIRAFALNPAIASAEIEGALSKFDARYVTSMSWQKRDDQVANIFNNFNNGDLANFSSGLFKPLPTGGVAGITVDLGYTRLSSVPAGFAVINPNYQPRLTFQFEHPLARDFGVAINQLIPQHPGSFTLQNFRPTGGRSEGILVTRLRSQQARADFERDLNLMVLNIEAAYWQFHANYMALYAANEGAQQAVLYLEQIRTRFEVGQDSGIRVHQAEAQLEQFRIQRLNALQACIESERQFRGLLNLPIEDGERLVPSDTPTVAPYKPDWANSVAEALNNRPELFIARQEVKAAHYAIEVARNATRPDLRFFGNYSLQGLGTRLDGGVPDNAISNLTDGKFVSYQLGLRLDMPLGFRDAHAQLRQAQLNLASAYIQLKNQEVKAERFLHSMYAQLEAAYEQIKLQRNLRLALGKQVQLQLKLVDLGRSSLFETLEGQQRFADALRAEAQAIANYNIAIAGFQYAKGSLLSFNNIQISEAALPRAVQQRAADHFAARTAALKIREREVPPTDPEGPIDLKGLPLWKDPGEKFDPKGVVPTNIKKDQLGMPTITPSTGNGVRTLPSESPARSMPAPPSVLPGTVVPSTPTPPQSNVPNGLAIPGVSVSRSRQD